MKKISAEQSLLTMLDGDLIFSMKANKGHILTSGIRVYVKTAGGWKQIGLIKKLGMAASCDKIQTKFEVIFVDHPKLSPLLKDSIKSNIKKLSKLGVDVKKQSSKGK